MYYIYENQKKPDGTINSMPIVGRQTINSGMSYFCERCSKMYMNDQFVSVAIMICDEDNRVIDSKIVKTMYIEPTATEEVSE